MSQHQHVQTSLAGTLAMTPNQLLKTFLRNGPHGNGSSNKNQKIMDDADHANKPLVDFFPKCTVFFGDIEGFTAWSSTREPAQVLSCYKPSTNHLMLLQNVGMSSR